MRKVITSKWIVVYTKPRHEKIVSKKLIQQNYQIYLPLIKQRRKWSDRKKWVELPLFKSYLFVKTELNNTLPILKTKGIIKIVRFGESIAIVKDSSIRSIKLMLKGGYIPEITDYFIKGDNVVVKDGPLKDIQGEVVRIDGKDRLIIRIDSIQHSLSIKINRSFLNKYEN